MPPPGWYPEPGTGAPRWWNGQEWGPYNTSVGPQPPNRTTAIIAHLGCFLGGFLVPLIIYLVTDKSDRFARDSSREALNFQLTQLVAIFGGMVLAFIIGVAAAAASEPLVILPIVIYLGAFAAISILNFVWGITAAVRTSRGEQYRYPLCVRFIRGDTM